MANKKTYSLTFDKYVPNKYGGVDIERSTVKAPNRAIADNVMKNNLYNYGAYGARGAVRYKNGSTEYIQPRKAPRITMSEKLESSVKRERMPSRYFGVFDASPRKGR